METFDVLGNLLVDSKSPFLVLFIVCCALLGYLTFVVRPETRRLKRDIELGAEIRKLMHELSEIKTAVESADNKSGNSLDLLPEVKRATEELKTLAESLKRVTETVSRLESTVVDLGRDSRSDNREISKAIQELYRAIGEINSRVLFISTSLSSPARVTDPNGMNISGIR